MSVIAAHPQRRIILAEVAGFCFGVRRAVDMAETARTNQSDRITFLGPLVHNDQVIERFRSEGINTAASVQEVSEGTIVLSAHGVAPSVITQAREQRLTILDVTCPFVTKLHRLAKQLHEQGYQIVIVGDKGHTEVRGVIGMLEALKAMPLLVSTPEEIKDLPLSKKVGVVSQTTQRSETFGRIVAAICQRAADVRALNTICGATDELQAAAIRLARHVDLVLVIGGRMSANTGRLRQLCEEQGVPAYQIETADQIVESWLAGKQSIGLTAGASTPDWIIEDVARRVNGGLLPEDWRLQHPDT